MPVLDVRARSVEKHSECWTGIVVRGEHKYIAGTGVVKQSTTSREVARLALPVFPVVKILCPNCRRFAKSCCVADLAGIGFRPIRGTGNSVHG